MKRDEKFHCCRHAIVPPCESTEREQQFRTFEDQSEKIMTYSQALSDAEAAEMAASLTLKIFEDRQFLKEQCKILGNTMLRRWKKKTKEKREALLLEVNPQMYPHQWCDAHFSLEFVPEWKTNVGKAVPDPDVTHRRPHRNVFLTPCINLEALKTDPARFLSLLYNRVKYSSEEWSSYDNFYSSRSADKVLSAYPTTATA
jgi:hypothetical protein